MLGWEVFVYRQIRTPQGEPGKILLARWMTGLNGLDWLEDLVKTNRAVDLGGDGYPCRYSIAAGVLSPVLSRGLPAHDGPPVIGDDYALPAGWNGDLKADHAALASRPSEEQLLVEAWDQS